ncbi:FAD-dependent oxidoreductase [Atribacter laminatus]|uniref:Thiazole biosynthetic enzyme n=1 Tax=Atribacter laminatus TaxID=2847778 RepID=A0A7T1AL51_ATRLM|nr:FAD-dependent oxidoreductase [Atribacter laminatus]QPM67938.1 Putative thiazole biosynthetic enzyme [Atribacter laminatus]
MYGIYEEKDVVVVGGGVAGLSAAISAARNGAKTLLIERNGILGGTATMGLMAVFMGFDRHTIGGVAVEFLENMKKLEGAIEGEYYAVFDPEVFKEVAFEMVDSAGVDLHLHTIMDDVIVKNDRIEGLITKSRLKHQVVLANSIIDTTGDADIAFSAGVAFEKGEGAEKITQPVTLIFKMGNVQIKELFQYIQNNPDEFTKGKYQTIASIVKEKPFFIAPGLFSLIKEARQRGDLQLDHNLIVLCSTPRPNEVLINATRSLKVDGTNQNDLTRAEIETRKQMTSVIKFLKKYVVGFSNSYLIESACSIGVRETRRIIGEYILNESDILNDKSFSDAIARNFFPMDVHGPSSDPEGHFWESPSETYQIPFRCLIPREFSNLLIAGRCISTTHFAQGSTRSMPCCMATGQAAGTAAALIVKKNIKTKELDIKLLQKTLIDQGVII